MRIVNLIENTSGDAECVPSHGLSFYIETKKHKILMDLGPSVETINNAAKLGIDLASVDTLILSHGHYDHAGGILPFATINSNTSIYMQRSACGPFYSEDDDGSFRYIGIDPKISELPNIVYLDGDFIIDEELRLLTVEIISSPIPSTNRRLKRKQGEQYVSDRFEHEQSLVITEGNQTVLFSGCAHNGILNILSEFKRKLRSDPDVVISGFHLMKRTDYTKDELLEIIDIAKELKKVPTQFYTCHCTGIPAYRTMKSIMGDKLEYIHSGDTVPLYGRTRELSEKQK